MNTITDQLQRAGQLLDLGQVVQAKELYLSTCEQNDNHEARLMLGAIDAEQGEVDQAIVHIEKAIQLKPDYADAYVTLGSIQLHLKKQDEAHECFLKATQLDDAYEEAWQLLSASFGQRGDYAEAERCARKAISIDPTYIDPKVNLANALKSQGKLKEAITTCIELVNAGKANNHILQTLAAAAFDDQQYTLAEKTYRQLLASNPSDSMLKLRLAELLHVMGNQSESKSMYEQIIETDRDNLKATVGLSMVLADLKDFSSAKKLLESRLTNDTVALPVLFGLSKIYYREGRVDDAIPLLRQIMAADPGSDTDGERIIFEAHSVYVFALNYISGTSPEKIVDEHRLWADTLKVDDSPATFDNRRDTNRRLRIGYVSPDLRRHSVAFYVEVLIKRHSRELFEVYCYSDTASPDSTTDYLRELSDEWRDISADSDDEVMRRVRDDQIDILIDLAGHTTGNRLTMFADRAAPVQMTFIGYPNTTGLKTMDYRITDAVADPETEEQDYSETLLRTKNCFLCYSTYSDSPDVTDAPFLSNDGITFGSFNSIQKVNNEVIGVWSKVLDQVENSTIILKNPAFAQEDTRERIFAEFESHGIERGRVQLFDLVPSYKEHMAMYGKVDIALDTFPYNGTTTTCEALWMGVPVVTFTGERHAGRVGSSLLTHIGHQEWIADDQNDFVVKAVDLASATESLSTVRHQLRQDVEKSSLCDPVPYVDDIESLYRRAWSDYCR